MEWIKRNLIFVVGSAVALALMAFAGFYFYSNWKLNNAKLEELNEAYAKLDRLSKQNPHPGTEKVDNIKAAREQDEQLQAFMKKVRKHFTPIPAIPPSPKVSSEEFAAALRRTIDQMQREATNASVMLPQRYNFSFEAQRPLIRFAEGSLQPLATQLGEIKSIVDVLVQAKVNSIDNIRRERVSADDYKGPQSDFLEQKSVTNDLAILAPYEVTFQCFSPELANVLSGFANSPYAIIVRAVNVDPAPPASIMDPSMPTPYYPPQPYPQPTPYTAPVRPRTPPPAEMEGDAFARRYGLDASATQMRTPTPRPVYVMPQPSGATRGGLPILLNEQQLRVTLRLEVIKLLPPAK